MYDPAETLRVVTSGTTAITQRAKDIVNKLPERVRPVAGTFEYQLAVSCTEVALTAPLDDVGASRATPEAVVQIARVMCSRDLPRNSCFSACQMHRRCLGQTKLVMISFGEQARASLRALGLTTEDVTVHDLVREDDLHQPRKIGGRTLLAAPKEQLP